MNNPEEPTSGELIKAGVELIKTAYGDALQPVAKEAGKALGTLGKTVNIALSPLRGLVWGWERIEYLPSVGRYEPLIDLAYSLPIKGEFSLCRYLETIGSDSKCQSPNSLPQLIPHNLCRLGLTEIPPMKRLAEDYRYDRIRALQEYAEAKGKVPEGGQFIELPKMLGMTILGESFRQACITDSTA